MKYQEFVNGITTAYMHKGGIKTLALGRLSASWFRQIQADCAHIIDGADPSDVNDKRHVTNWTRPTGEVRQFSLFNISGKTEDTTGDYGYLGDVRKKSLVFPKLEGLSRFARLFMPDLRNLRMNGMGPNSALNAHEEGSITATRYGRQHILRFHLPIFTNPGARMFLDDEWFRYEDGTLYFFNHGCVHAVANDSSEPRYHLVLDCFLSKGLFRRLFPGQRSPDPEFRLAADADAFVSQIGNHHFPDFVCEGGRVIEGPIDYGRSVPHWTDWYRTNYPSVFSPLTRSPS
jgi:hypothetical protein